MALPGMTFDKPKFVKVPLNLEPKRLGLGPQPFSHEKMHEDLNIHLIIPYSHNYWVGGAPLLCGRSHTDDERR